MRRASQFLLAFALLNSACPALRAQDATPGDALTAARTAFASARQAAADASDAVAKADLAQLRLERALRVEYASKPDLLSARQYAGQLALHYNALRNAVLKELQADPHYQSLLEEERLAEQATREASDDVQTPLDQRLRLVRDLLEARTRITRYEAAACALDPAIEDARVMMNGAHQVAGELEARYAERARLDPRLAAADEETRHARERLAAARAALADAKSKLADAEKRSAIRNASRRSNAPPVARPADE